MFSKILALFTIPGVVVHEFGHQFFCHLMRVKVREVCYFRFGNPAGYVMHDQAGNFVQAFFISAGPLLFGSLFSAVMFYFFQSAGELEWRMVYMWLGFSVAMHCLPSRGDAKSLWQQNWSQAKSNILAIFGMPLVFIIWVLSMLNFLVFNISYAILLYMISQYI